MALTFGTPTPRRTLTKVLLAGVIAASAVNSAHFTPSVVDYTQHSKADFAWQKLESCYDSLWMVSRTNGWTEADVQRCRALINRGAINHSDLGAAGVQKWSLDTLVQVKKCSLSKDQKDRDWLKDNGFTAAALAWGTGFGGNTSTPAAVGAAGAGYTGVPMARWDRVLYDLVSGTAYVGVVAFHYNGIDNVKFSIHGGAETTVSSMTLNADTGVWSYVAEIDTTTAPADGVYEIRATVTPLTRGQCVVLQGDLGTDWSTNKRGRHGYWLACNNGGTLTNTAKYVSTAGSDTTGDGSNGNPYATLEKAAAILNGPGRIIVKTAGNYAFGNGTASTITLTQRWMTVESDGALGATDVVINTVDTAGIGATHVKFVNLKIAVTGNIKARHIWLSGVTNDPNAVTTSDTLINSTYSYYAAATSSSCTRCRNGLRSIAHAVGNTYYVMSGACMGSTGFTANQDVYEFSNQGFHGDLYHWFNFATIDTAIPTSPPATNEDSDTNVIVWGVEAFQWGETALFIQVQGTGTAPDLVISDGPYFNNFAFVNIHISDDGQGTVPRNSYNWADCDHGLYWYNTLPDQNLGWKQDDFNPNLTLTNISAYANICYSMNAFPTTNTHTLCDENHFMTGTSRGTNATNSNDPGFQAYGTATSGNFATRRAKYTLDPDSPVADRIAVTPKVPVDAELVARTNPGNGGAYETTAERVGYNPMPQKPLLADTGYRSYAWGTSLAENALYLWHFNEGSGDSAADLIASKTLTQNTGAGSGGWTTAGFGTGITNPIWATATSAITSRPSFPYTVMAAIIAPDQASSGVFAVFDNNADNTNYSGIYITSTGLAAVARDGPVSSAATGTVDITDGKLYVVFGVFRGASDRSVYVYDTEGTLVDSADSTAANGAVTVTGMAIGHQQTTGPTYSTRFIDEIGMVAVFSVAASSAQMQAAAVDPFAIINDPPDFTFEVPAATIVESYDFGEIDSGTTNSVTITLHNYSGGTLTSVAASVSGSDFEISTSPASSVTNGNTTTVVVDALRVSTGAKSTTLTVTHSGSDSPQTFLIYSVVSEAVVPVGLGGFRARSRGRMR